MNRNWRAVIPQRRTMITWCVIYLLTYIPNLYAIYLSIPMPEEMAEPMGGIRVLILALSSALYAICRVVPLHPFYNRTYGGWLCLTPWSIEKPLPRGPIHIIWIDLIVLSFLTVLTYHNLSFFACIPVIIFLSVYLLLMCITFEGKESGFAVLCLFLAPFAIYPFANRYFAVLVLILLYIICWVGLRQFLRDFPWNTKYWKVDIVKELREQAIRHRVIGWPFSILNIYEISSISVFGALLWSLLLTWWLHVIQWVSGGSFSLFWIVILALTIALFRIAIYSGEYRPPISLLGRIFTGRLIIPKYDRIYVAPFCIVMAGTLLPFVLGRLGVNSTLNFELCFFLIFFLAFSLPPTLNEWRLTGAFQIGRLAQLSQTRQPSRQDQPVVTYFSSKFKSS